MKRSDLQKPPQVAVVGAGYWGKNLVRNFDDLGALSCICDQNESELDSLKKQYPECRIVRSYDEVLKSDSLSAIVLATPAETHTDLAQKALRAGKDVFIEKPLSLSVSDGKMLVDLAREKNRILMVGHLLWYHPAVLKLEELVRQGELGRIHYIYSNRLNLGKIRREENILWSFAPHDISVILGLLGEMPAGVQAQGGNYLHPRISDVTVSLLTFSSGINAHIYVSWLHPFKEQKLVVVGERKMAVFNDMEKKDKLLIYPHTINWKNSTPVAQKADAHPVEFDWVEPLRAECLHFLECIQTRQSPRTDGEEGLRVLTVLKQCEEALEGRSSTHQSRMTSDTGSAQTIATPPGFFAHSTAVIDQPCQIGQGTRIWLFSHVMKNAVIGEKCTIGQNVMVGSDVVIGDQVKIQNNVSVYTGVTLEDGVFCGPAMVFTNVLNPRSTISRKHEFKKTLVKKGATLGANCTVLCGLTIGQCAFVGAGAVVTQNVPDYGLLYGNPARLQGWICRCGVQLPFSDDSAVERVVCRACGDSYKCEDNQVGPLSEGS